MRTTFDRIRHAILFEVLGLIFIVFILGFLGFDMMHTGMMGLFFSVIATGWNYIYNILFDKMLIRHRGTSEKTQKHRIIHAVLFEMGLLVFTLPILAWWMSINLWQAFLLDIGLVIFYLFYAYIFNLAYDKAFPIKQ